MQEISLIHVSPATQTCDFYPRSSRLVNVVGSSWSRDSGQVQACSWFSIKYCPRIDMLVSIYLTYTNKVRQNSLKVGHPKTFCNYPKIGVVSFYYRVMGPNDADGMANSVNPDQTAPLCYGSTLFAQTCLSVNLGSLRYVVEQIYQERLFRHSRISWFIWHLPLTTGLNSKQTWS